MKLEMLPPSNSVIGPNTQDSVTQELRVTNTMQGDKSIVLKLKFSYSAGGKTVEDMVSVSSFPPLY